MEEIENDVMKEITEHFRRVIAYFSPDSFASANISSNFHN